MDWFKQRKWWFNYQNWGNNIKIGDLTNLNQRDSYPMDWLWEILKETQYKGIVPPHKSGIDKPQKINIEPQCYRIWRFMFLLDVAIFRFSVKFWAFTLLKNVTAGHDYSPIKMPKKILYISIKLQVKGTPPAGQVNWRFWISKIAGKPCGYPKIPWFLINFRNN
jgi:hypothetical protein